MKIPKKFCSIFPGLIITWLKLILHHYNVGMCITMLDFYFWLALTPVVYSTVSCKMDYAKIYVYWAREMSLLSATSSSSKSFIINVMF